MPNEDKTVAVKPAEKTLTINSDYLGEAELAARRRKKQVVLEEDEYLSDMEKIITRDFFPDLPEIVDKLAYMEAYESQDLGRMKEIMLRGLERRKQRDRLQTPSGSQLMTPASQLSTPSTFETPMGRPAGVGLETPQPDAPDATPSSVVSGPISGGANNRDFEPEDGHDGSVVAESCQPKVGAVDRSDLSLDKYMSRYTSEDNESFVQNVYEQNKRNRKAKSYLYEGVEEMNAKALENVKLPSLEEQAVAGAIDSGSLSVQNWSYRPLSSLLFPIEGEPDEMASVASKKPRIVRHENTRLRPAAKVDSDGFKKPYTPNISQQPSPAPPGRASRIGIDGKLVMPSPKGRSAGQGYGMLATPSPRPGIDDSPMMTWGEIASTPVGLTDTPYSTHGTPGPAFKLSEVSEREKLAMQLGENARKSYKSKKEKAISVVRDNMPQNSPRFSRLNALSPAARRLATHRLSLGSSSPALRKLSRSSGSSSGIDQALRASYQSPSLSPFASPSVRRKTPATSRLVTRNATPASKFDSSESSVSTPTRHMALNASSITDDLLSLPTTKVATAATGSLSAEPSSAEPSSAESATASEPESKSESASSARRSTAADFF